MTTVYHVTDRKSVPSIMAEGLRPIRTKTFDEEGPVHFYEERRVYFFRDLDAARSDHLKVSSHSDPVLVRIQLRDGDRVRTHPGYPVTWGFVEVPKGNLVRPMDVVELTEAAY